MEIRDTFYCGTFVVDMARESIALIGNALRKRSGIPDLNEGWIDSPVCALVATTVGVFVKG